MTGNLVCMWKLNSQHICQGLGTQKAMLRSMWWSTYFRALRLWWFHNHSVFLGFTKKTWSLRALAEQFEPPSSIQAISYFPKILQRVDGILISKNKGCRDQTDSSLLLLHPMCHLPCCFQEPQLPSGLWPPNCIFDLAVLPLLVWTLGFFLPVVFPGEMKGINENSKWRHSALIYGLQNIQL